MKLLKLENIFVHFELDTLGHTVHAPATGASLEDGDVVVKSQRGFTCLD